MNPSSAPLLELSFSAEIIYWRGPAPFYFLRVPEIQSKKIAAISKQITYGWGVLPTEASAKGVDFYTALFPKDGGYLLPLKKSVRDALKRDYFMLQKFYSLPSPTGLDLPLH